MDLIKAAMQDEVIGRDFLTWLVCKAARNDYVLSDGNGGDISVFPKDRITITGGSGELTESVSMSGEHPECEEIKAGLRRGKYVTKLTLIIGQDGHEWRVALDSTRLDLNGLRTPRVSTTAEVAHAEGDADALFLEKLYLIERASGFVRGLFKQFLKLRLSTAWQTEVLRFKSWLAEA